MSSACTTRQLVQTPSRYIAEERPSQIWVTQDERVLHVAGPRLLGDTLVGFIEGEYREVPIARFGQVYAQRVDTKRTTLLVGGIMAGIGLGSYLLWGFGLGDDNVPDPEGEEMSRQPAWRPSAVLVPLIRLRL